MIKIIQTSKKGMKVQPVRWSDQPSCHQMFMGRTVSILPKDSSIGESLG